MKQYLDDEAFNVKFFSREAGMSLTQWHRKLKALLNQAPGDYIRLVRLQRARELLAGNVGTAAKNRLIEPAATVPQTFQPASRATLAMLPARPANGQNLRRNSVQLT